MTSVTHRSISHAQTASRIVEQSPQPTKKPKYAIATDHLVPENLMYNQTSIYMMPLRGGLDIIYFENANAEGFVQPLVSILFKNPDNMEDKVKQNDLRKITNIVYVIPKRLAPRVNEPKWKIKTPNEKYKEHYFVRVCPPEDNTPQSRHNCLEALAQFLNEHQIQEDMKKGRQGSKAQYKVAPDQPDYTMDDERKEPWNHRFVDSDVGRLMAKLIRPMPTTTFFHEADQRFTQTFFAEPYPSYAQENFGYVNTNW